MMMNKSADAPEFQVFANQARRGLVHVGVGTGTRGYNIAPEDAEALAATLVEAAEDAREMLGGGAQ